MSVLKYLLWPIAALYGSLTQIRNFLFDKNIKKSFAFDLPVIGVGNLSVGGSGKTPLSIWILDFLKNQNYHPAMLSRGYGRRTSGFGMVRPNSDSQSCGDEPVMVFQHFEGLLPVGVCEKRLEGLPLMLSCEPNINAFVLDDVFQHRQLRPSLNLLLSEWSKPFFKDALLPLGRLRELPTSAKRASALIITKTPTGIDAATLEAFRIEAARHLLPNTPIFFSYLLAQSPKSVFEQPNNSGYSGFDADAPVFLFSGIARPEYFTIQAAKFSNNVVDHRIFNDHHDYNLSDIKQIIELANKNLATQFGHNGSKNSKNIQFLCTQKDAIKLLKPELKALLVPYKVFYLPVVHQFYDISQERAFGNLLKSNLGFFSLEP